MTRVWRRIAVLTGILAAIPLVGVLAIWFLFNWKSAPSNILDFSPSSFTAKADKRFFYSLKGELKYSDEIDSHAPTLVRGEIKNFLVAPDGKKMAAVVNERLLVIGTDSVLAQIADVDSIYREPKPIGRQFFRDDDFQWSQDSKSVYLIKDEFYDLKGSQLFSDKGELWKYDLESRNFELVIKPFRAYTYFLGAKSGIYYSEPTDRGDLQLKYFDGRTSTNVDVPNAPDIKKLPGNAREASFYSFSIIDYERALKPFMHVKLEEEQNGSGTLLINDKPYLSLTRGHDFKGSYYCSELLRSVFLPGDNFFVLNVPGCGNYKGQLLFDLTSTKYETLPSDTVVFVTLNTRTLGHYRISAGGIELRFQPADRE